MRRSSLTPTTNVSWQLLSTLTYTDDAVHDMDQNLVVRLNQAAINGIRGVGAKTQWIHVEGNSWTGAWTWTKSGNGATMAALTDPSNKIMYQMHQYLDTDGSGT